MCTHSGSGNGGRTPMQPTVLKDGYSLSVDEARRTPPRFFKAATESESSEDAFGILEDDRCIDTGVFRRRYLVHECSPPPPPRLQIILS